jgi:hypothetical protein
MLPQYPAPSSPVAETSVSSRALTLSRVVVIAMLLALAPPPLAHAGQVVSVESTGVTSGALYAVTATGLDAAAAQNEFTFTPTSGEAVVVAATSSAVVDASRGIRRISVRVPAGIPLGPAGVTIRNLATGETTDAGTVQILALSVPDPARGTVGQSGVSIRLRASDGTRFTAGQTRVTFGAQVRVASVGVVSPTELLAVIDIPITASPGPRTISVTVPRQSLILANAFIVEPQAPPTNQAPTARFTFAPPTPQVNQAVTFDASTSSDPDAGDTLTYAWTFGDGATTTGVSASHAFASAGPFTVTLTVSDGKGGTHSTSQAVTVAPAPPTNQAPTARFTFAPPTPQVNQAVTFDASTSSDPDAGDTLP